MEGKKREWKDRLEWRANDWTDLFIFIFEKYCRQFVLKERKGNGRIDWSGKRMIGLIYFIFIFIFEKYCRKFVWKERKGNGRIDWRGERMIGLIYYYFYF